MVRHAYVFAALAALAAAPAHAGDGPVVIYPYAPYAPYVANYPGQQLCQVDPSDRRYSEFCAAPSYHPYGISGYRPYGTYRPHHNAPGFWVAPDARIIHIPPQEQ